MSTTLLSRLTACAMLMLATTAIMSNSVQAHEHGEREGHERYETEQVRRYSPGYQYIYYPARQIYFSPQFRTWYWPDGRGWVSGSQLPSYFRIDFRAGGIPVSLSSPYPYTEHVYVEQNYGRPWRRYRDWHDEDQDDDDDHNRYWQHHHH